jgi:hypothetical protein
MVYSKVSGLNTPDETQLVHNNEALLRQVVVSIRPEAVSRSAENNTGCSRQRLPIILLSKKHAKASC